MTKSKATRWLYWFWIYTLIVIAWGAWVRISHSGNGCGDHWPLCHGDFIPNLENKKTFVEYSHRLMSGVYGLIVFWIFYVFYSKRNTNLQSKKISLYLLIFMIIEALLGALLVKQSLVTVNDSIFRLVAMSLHQLNSFLLTGTTYLLYKSTETTLSLRWTKLNITVLLLAVSGAMASLATTLFPSISVLDGIIKDFSEHSHLFVRLRILHPIFAVVSVTGVIYWLNTKSNATKRDQHLALKLFGAMIVGIVTLVTLSPVWLKLSHLMIAHFIWAEILKYQLLGQHKSI